MASPTEINVQQLSRLVGTPTCPKILDVRTDEDFDQAPEIIPGAVRCSYNKIQELIPELRDDDVIVYCQKGFKISQGSAAILRAEGIKAETLKGGHIAWQESGLPLVPVAKIPRKAGQHNSIWVTRHRPKIDRIACPWLIRRFIDPQALFLFVEPSQVLLVAEKFNATAFDVEDVFFSHRGEYCTFDIMIEEFGLKTQALLRLAKVIQGADTNCHNLAPECAGLLAISTGLSRMYKDDLAQMEAGMLIYDAYYRWARDAYDEQHNWPTGKR